MAKLINVLIYAIISIIDSNFEMTEKTFKKEDTNMFQKYDKLYEIKFEQLNFFIYYIFNLINKIFRIQFI